MNYLSLKYFGALEFGIQSKLLGDGGGKGKVLKHTILGRRKGREGWSQKNILRRTHLKAGTELKTHDSVR